MDQSDLELLQMAPSHHLQALVKTRHVPTTAKGLPGESSPTDASSSSGIEIAQALFDPTSLKEVIQSLGEIERLILQELVACGGRANSRDLALYLTSGSFLTGGKKAEGAQEAAGDVVASPEAMRWPQQGMTAPTTQTLQYLTAHPHGVFEQSLRRLLVLGLVFWGKQTNFASRDYTSGVHDGVLIVPQAVRDVVRSEWGDGRETLATSTVRNEENVSDVEDVGDGARALQRTLYLYWSLVTSMREGLALVSNGLLSRSALRQVVEHMGATTSFEQARVESDAPRLLFIRLLLMKLGLLQERRGVLYAVAAESFFSSPLVARARRCYHLWLETPFWNELLYLPEVNVRPGPAPLDAAHEEVVRARHMVVERVVHEQVGKWSELSTFIARTKLYAPYLLFPRQYGPRAERYLSDSNPYGWDFRLRRGWLTHREGWYLVEGGFVRTVITGPLHWLGLVDIDRAENPGTFRLSSSASLLTSDAPITHEGSPWGRLIVQPNFELVALAPVSEALLINLDRFAERIGLEHIAQYRLTKASVTRAIQMGLHAETIQAALEHAAGGDIPQNVQYSLTEWERQARRVEVWSGAALLEVNDGALLDALFADEETRPLFGRRLAPLLAEVAPHKLSAVQEALWRRNYLPALTAAPTQETVLEHGHLITREPQWRLHDDGLLQPFYAVLDLYLSAEVERFSERDEVTGWRRITPSALQRAQASGLSLEHVVRFLQQYCEGGVPASFLIRLKLWGNGYGEQGGVQVERAPLLYLSSQVLQDLQADEELGQLLGPEVEQQSCLVRVDADNIERVVELLRERGFVVE